MQQLGCNETYPWRQAAASGGRRRQAEAGWREAYSPQLMATRARHQSLVNPWQLALCSRVGPRNQQNHRSATILLDCFQNCKLYQHVCGVFFLNFNNTFYHLHFILYLLYFWQKNCKCCSSTIMLYDKNSYYFTLFYLAAKLVIIPGNNECRNLICIPAVFADLAKAFRLVSVPQRVADRAWRIARRWTIREAESKVMSHYNVIAVTVFVEYADSHGDQNCAKFRASVQTLVTSEFKIITCIVAYTLKRYRCSWIVYVTPNILGFRGKKIWKLNDFICFHY